MTDKKIWQVCVAAIAVGIAILFYGLYVWINAESQTKWPVVQGKIESSRVESDEDYGSNGNTSYFDTSKVVYSYAIAGQSFRSVQRTDSRALADSYQRGAAASIHYDPTNPSSSILEPELRKGKVYTWVGFVICLLFPIATKEFSRQFNLGKRTASRTSVQDQADQSDVRTWKQRNGMTI